jgi:hypothetical protein
MPFQYWSRFRAWRTRAVGLGLGAAVFCFLGNAAAMGQRLLYVAVPGVQNHYPDNNYNLRYGGIGILVFDIDHNYRFVKRIKTFDLDPTKQVEIVKGIDADAASHRLYITTPNLIVAYDLLTDQEIWRKSYEGGFDRTAISPDGKTLYSPAFEGPYWNVIRASDGERIDRLEPNIGSHNTIWSPDGSLVYMEGLHSPYLLVADPKTNKVVKQVGPFSDMVRPFTVNGSNSLCFVNVNKRMGFEVGDIKTGKKLYEVNVEGYPNGHAIRHGCPSHGIALSYDEKELWLADGVNNYLHVFDTTVMPPKQISDIKVTDSPGWIDFDLTGNVVYPSTGDVIDRKTRKIITTLRDEHGVQVQSEKIVEIDFKNGKPVRNSVQFGVGQKR